MENDWHKKRIYRLLNADSEILDEFLDQFAPAIYTWMYYQVGTDEAIALDLTEQTLNRTIEQLPQFDPGRETFYQWLKQQAKEVRDDGLLHLQMKPQRPWAWSQLSDSVLYSLSRIRQENLPESVCNNPCIQEITKAALAEMAMPDRTLMMHRYNRLDTPEHIAEEMNIRPEDIEDRLYRCRHSFKRIFVQLLASSNAGFSESNTSAETEVLDSNLEKLLSATDMNQPMKPAQREKLRVKFCDAAQKYAANHVNVPSAAHKIAIGGLIAGAIAIVIVAGVLIMALKNKHGLHTPPEVQPTPPTQNETMEKTPAPTATEPPKNELNNAEIQKIFALGAAGNVDALMEVLKSGQKINQITAAIFLGQIAGPSAIGPLSDAEQQWYPDGPADNPFRVAINAIAKRFPDEIETVEEEVPAEKPAAEPNTPPVEAETQTVKPNETIPSASDVAIIGNILDPDENPLKATVALIQNLSSPLADDGRIIASAESDQDGQFKITKDFSGLAYLRTTIQSGRQSRILTRAIWGQKGNVNKAAFSAKPLLLGSMTTDGSGPALQTLYLCDAPDPAGAAYAQQTQTDNNGNFEFWSVPPGSYSLFRIGLDNRLYRLGQVQMPPADAFRINLPVDPVQVTVELPQVPADANDLSVVLDSQLAYGPNVSEKLNRYEGTVTEDNLILFDNVLPGSYLLRMQVADNVWVHQTVEVAAGTGEQFIEAAPLPLPNVVVTGRFLSPSPLGLFLTNPDRTLHVDLAPGPNGTYELNVPADIYQLAVVIEGESVELDSIDLQDESVLEWNIDPATLLNAKSPLYVMTVDEDGFVVAGAQVILNTENTATTTVTGKNGAFFAAEPGQAQITALLSGVDSAEKAVEIAPGKLPSKPTPENTVLIRFGE